MAVVQVCRTCLITDVKMFDLTSSDNLVMFMDLTGITDMGMHHNICYLCLGMLRKFETFRKNCLLSDGILSFADVEVTKEEYQKYRIKNKLSSNYISLPPEVISIDNTEVKNEANINPGYGYENMTVPATDFNENENDDSKKVDTLKTLEALTFSEWASSFGVKEEPDPLGTDLKSEHSDYGHDSESDSFNSTTQYLTNYEEENSKEFSENIPNIDSDHNEAEILSEHSDRESKKKKKLNINLKQPSVITNFANKRKIIKRVYEKVLKYNETCLTKDESTLSSYNNDTNTDNAQFSEEIEMIVNDSDGKYIESATLSGQQNSVLDEFNKSVKNLNKPKISLKEHSALKNIKTIIERVNKKILKKNKKKQKKKSDSTQWYSTLISNNKLQDTFSILTVTPEEVRLKIEARKESKNYQESPYKCEHCYLGFIRQPAYENHMLKHSPSIGPHECNVCFRRFPTKKDLNAHLTKVHATKFKCKVSGCNYICLNRCQAFVHMKMHKGKTYRCEICDKTFNFRNSLAGHVRFKHPIFFCSFCGENFSSERGLASHRYHHHKGDINNRLGPYCSECDVHFSNEFAYKRHRVLSAKHDVRNGCKKCGESFESKGKLIVHLREHNAVDTNDVCCLICDEQFSNSLKYHSHMGKVHSEEAKGPTEKNITVMCELCGETFPSEIVLQRHLEMHTGTKHYKCDICLKSYKSRASFHRHKLYHKREPVVHCELCDRTYSTPTSYNKHVRTTHQNLRPYKCEYCDKRFHFPSVVRTHVKHVHMREPWPKRYRDRSKRQRTKDIEYLDESMLDSDH